MDLDTPEFFFSSGTDVTRKLEARQGQNFREKIFAYGAKLN